MNSTDNAESIKIAIELTLLPGVGCLAQNSLWKSLPDISDLFSMDPTSLESIGVPGEALSVVRSRGYREIAAEIYDWGAREDCHFLLRGKPGYPALLEEIYDPPLLLYARGHLEALNHPGVAIVGTRKPTIYGLHIVRV